MDELETTLWLHLATVTPLMIFKLAVLWVGYLIAKLGYDLLVKGVGGSFKFQGEFRGGKADLISASPGIFFIFLATILLAIAVIVDKPWHGPRRRCRKALPYSPCQTVTGAGCARPTWCAR